MNEIIPLNNSFGSLTDDSLPSTEEETPSDESGNIIRRPGRYLRVLVNCRSLKFITKQTGFAELAELRWLRRSTKSPQLVNLDTQPIDDLHCSLENIPDRNNLPNIILGGDLNLPSIDWENNNPSIA